jgi:CDP-diacylglycerol--glycerol-3-phosphate 3-phosphatidyltransferase
MTIQPSTQPSSKGAAFRAGFRQRIEAPVAAVFIRTHLTPNMLTLIGFGIAIVGAYLAAIQLWIPAGLVVGFGAAFDLFDGALARATGKSSKLGAFMDSVFDRAGEAVVYIGIVAGCLSADFTAGALLAAAAMAAAFMVSYTRAKSESLGFSSGSGLANVGLAPREVRSIILVIGLLAVGFAGYVGPWSFPACPTDLLISCIAPDHFHAADLVLGGTLGLIAILATVTTIQRILFVYNQAKSTN